MSDILRWKYVKTRKPHRCNGCRKVYLGGTTLASAACADGGTVFSYYMCPTCEEYVRRYFKPYDEFSDGDIYNGDPEAWEALKIEMEATNAEN